jgi:hypothetical protein
MSTCGYSVFPAYGQVYLRNYNSLVVLIIFTHELYISLTRLYVYQMPIVTAAVYRGFDQELRLAADPIN